MSIWNIYLEITSCQVGLKVEMYSEKQLFGWFLKTNVNTCRDKEEQAFWM